MKGIKLKTVAIWAFLFVIAFGAGSLIGRLFEGSPRQSIEKKASQGKPFNILFMGIDARGTAQNSRSDTMILASIDSKSKKVAMVWIPRDTRVKVSGHYDKINSVNFVQGPEAACSVVGDLLDIDVNNYVVTNFNGFAKIVDILGGVTMNVEGNMYHYDPDPKLAINLHSGEQKLNGADAIRYVRYRGGPTADIGRTGRQQQFITALADEMFKTKTILKLPQLVPELAANVHTNIPMSDMIYMVKLAQGFKDTKIITQTLPGYSFTDPGNGASYWQADASVASGIVDKLFEGSTFKVAQDPPKSLNRPVASNTATPEETAEPEPDEEALLEEQNGSETNLPEQEQEGSVEENTPGDGDKTTVPPDQSNPPTGSGNSTGSTDTAPAPTDQPPGTTTTVTPPVNVQPDQNSQQSPGTGSAGY